MKPLNSTSPDSETAAQASRGKPIPCTDLQYTTAGFTLPALGGYALRCLVPTRATMAPTYPVPVRRLVPLLHASFKPRLATTPLRFATLHLHQVGRGTFTLLVSRHARHTSGTAPRGGGMEKAPGGGHCLEKGPKGPVVASAQHAFLPPPGCECTDESPVHPDQSCSRSIPGSRNAGR